MSLVHHMCLNKPVCSRLLTRQVERRQLPKSSEAFHLPVTSLRDDGIDFPHFQVTEVLTPVSDYSHLLGFPTSFLSTNVKQTPARGAKEGSR